MAATWSRSLVAALLVAFARGQGSTVFDVLFKPIPGEPAPQEYFAEMQTYIQDTENSPLYSNREAFEFLSNVDPDQEIKVSRTLIVCDLDPFWEKGAVRADIRDCPLSVIKVVVYALIPTSAMFFAMIGLWSKQANVGGRGKDTQVGGMAALGLSLLNVGYDWFFCATIFTEPKGEVQIQFAELGMGHLIAACLINFFLVHCWFRRKYLVGMPWYEYHKHGISLHIIFSLMYFQPQACNTFTTRLFNSDIFNIHFGTPSKMNEVLSKLGCLSLFHDIPQLGLQFWVFYHAQMNEAPAVSRVSMGLSVLSIAMVCKRQYIAVVERQWYKEIVRMAGVRRLTTYGGASKWLKMKKRGSAAQAAKQASTSQQQLFLAWMQSMGRRQESVFAGDTSAGAIQDGDSEDSEDLIDSLSSSSDDDKAVSAAASSKKSSSKSQKEPGEGAGVGDMGEGPESGEGSESESFGEGSESEGEGEGSEEEGSGASEASGSVIQQRYRGGRRDETGDEEAPMGRRRPGGGSDLLGYARHVADGASNVTSALRSDATSGDLLGFARGVVDDLSGTDVTSNSDVFAFARKVAGRAEGSESGFVTESSVPSRVRSRRRRRTAADRRAAFDDVDDLSIGDESSGFRSGTDVLSYARRAADDASGFTSAMDSESGTGDILNFAKRIARDASQSGVGGSRVSESDILAFAQQVAGAASEVSGAGTRSDILAFAREVAGQAPSESGAGTSDIFGVARKAAEGASESGVGSESDIMAFALRAAAEPSDITGVSQATSGSDIFAAARRAAGDVSRSGIGGSMVSGVSKGGGRLPSIPSAPPSEGGSESDIMAAARRAAGGGLASGVGSEGDSDIFGFALKAAGNISRSGVGASESGVGVTQRTGVSSTSDIFAAARNAADGVSQSGVGSDARGGQAASDAGVDDIFAVARHAAGNASRSGVGSEVPGSAGGMSDIFGTAVREAADMQSGVGSDGGSDIFAAARAAAGDVSQSGVGTGVTGRNTSRSTGMGGMSDLFAPPSRPRAGGDLQAKQLPGQPPARLPGPPGRGPQQAPMAPPMSSRSAISEDDDDDDIFAAARRAADDASQSGVQSKAHSVAMSAGMQDLFGGRRAPAKAKAAPKAAPKVASSQYQFQPPQRGAPPPNDMQSEAGSDFDVFNIARDAAADLQSGVGSVAGSDLFGAAMGAAGEASRSGVGDDLFISARRAGEEASQSGVGSDDIFAAARNAADAASRSGVSSGGGSDIFAAARAAAQGAGSRSGVGSGVSGLGAGGRDFQFMQQAPQRRRVQEGRHASAPPLEDSDDGDQPPWAQVGPASQDQRGKRTAGLQGGFLVAPESQTSVAQPLSSAPPPPKFPKAPLSPSVGGEKKPPSTPPPLPTLPPAQTAVNTNSSFFVPLMPLRPKLATAVAKSESLPEAPSTSSPQHPQNLSHEQAQKSDPQEFSRDPDSEKLRASNELTPDSGTCSGEAQVLVQPHIPTEASPQSQNLTARNLFDFARDIAAAVQEPDAGNLAPAPSETDPDDIFLRPTPRRPSPKASPRRPESPEHKSAQASAMLGKRPSQERDSGAARTGIMAFARSIAAQTAAEVAKATDASAADESERPPSPRSLRRLAEQHRNASPSKGELPPVLPKPSTSLPPAAVVRSGPSATPPPPSRAARPGVPPLALGGRLTASTATTATATSPTGSASTLQRRPGPPGDVVQPDRTPLFERTDTMKGVQEFMLSDETPRSQSQQDTLDTMTGVQEFLLTSRSAVERSRFEDDGEVIPGTPRNRSASVESDTAPVSGSPSSSSMNPRSFGLAPESPHQQHAQGSPQSSKLSPKERQERQRQRREMLMQEGEHRDYKRKNKRNFNLDTEPRDQK